MRPTIAMLVNRQNMNISAYKSLPVSAKRESLVAQGCDTVRKLATSQQHTYNTYVHIYCSNIYEILVGREGE